MTSAVGIAVTHDPDADCEPSFTPSHSNSSDLDPTDLDKRCPRETHSSAEDGDVDEDTNLHDGSHSTEPFDECLEEGNYHLIRLSTTSSQYTMTSAVGIAVTHDPDADCEPSFTPSHSNSSDLDPTDLDKRCARETHSNAEDGDVDEDTNLHDGSHSTEPFHEGLEEGNYHVIRSSSTLSQSTVTSADGFAVTHDPGAEGRMVRSEASSTISRDARPSRCVKAKYAYLGDVDNALSFEKGDLLHVIRDEHADWLLGYSDVNKQYGLIPRNRVDYQEGPEPCLNRLVDAPDNCLEVVTATGGYAPDPENVYQLRLSEGDELHVVRHDYPGKWLVVYNTRSQEYGISHFNLLDENLARGTYHVTKENEMVALFSFTSRTSDEISLEKGDLVSAVHDSGYWLKVRRNVSQKAGLVPQHYVARVGSLDTFEWFHGVLSVTGSVQRLNEERNSGKGTFLVRLSETRTDGYTISLVVKKSAGVMHYPIEKDNRDATFSCDGKVKFISLELLVDHYSKSDQDFLKCPLGHCCEKPLPPVWEVRSGPRDEWELPQGCLKMLEKIGSGNFGIVYLGKWFDERDVAIKVLKEGAMAKSEFRDEADVMKNLHHENILKLIGVCSEDEPLMIVTQYIGNGSLDKFLQKQENRDVTLNDLMLMAHHIVMGMAYMESMKYIHRDLGARNILVGDDCVMKIADFGLARLIKDNEYLSRGMTFPIKWTAPEAIHNHRFSVKSDVWSFGIVLVEMLTEGATPYPNVSKERVTDLVLTEYRHPKPNKCSYKLYDIMLRCWEADPSLRPSFEELAHELAGYKKTLC